MNKFTKMIITAVVSIFFVAPSYAWHGGGGWGWHGGGGWGGWHGGGPGWGYWHGGYGWHRGWGWGNGVVVGAAVGTLAGLAIASNPYYYAPAPVYYYPPPPVVAAPAPVVYGSCQRVVSYCSGYYYDANGPYQVCHRVVQNVC